VDTMTRDPINLLIGGVGGQGNVRMAGIIGEALQQQGYLVAIGDTLGGAQRGGSVASHIRISRERQYGPCIPAGCADIILGMEPVETLRMLAKYGKSQVVTVTGTRPISSVDIFGRRANYPDLETVMAKVREMSGQIWIIDAVEEAFKLGNPVYANMILVGALIGTCLLPLNLKSLEPVIRETFGKDFAINIRVLGRGIELAQK